MKNLLKFDTSLNTIALIKYKLYLEVCLNELSVYF